MNIVLLPAAAYGQSDFVLRDPATVHHIKNVLKLHSGDTLKIGVLMGNIGLATVARVYTDAIYLTDICCEQPAPIKLDLTVILALPRPKVLRRLLMDMTAIGVKQIILVNSYRTDKSYWQSPMLARIDEFVLQGLQQGVDTVPPSVQLKKRFKPFVEDELSIWVQSQPQLLQSTLQSTLQPALQPQRMVVAHPYAKLALSDYEAMQGQAQIVCIGAEGGWIDYELQLFSQQGAHTVGLGARILRTEAAVNVLCGRYL